MALPSSGVMTAQMINVELKRDGTAPFNINGAEERKLAGNPSGAIQFSDFYGKSSEITIVAPVAGPQWAHDIINAHQAGLWASDTDKRLVVTSGRGQIRVQGGWGGQLIIQINPGGTLHGVGGVANSGWAQEALAIETSVSTSNRVIVINNGTIAGGGGAGGRGGDGGNGGNGYWVNSYRVSDPSNGSYLYATGVDIANYRWYTSKYSDGRPSAKLWWGQTVRNGGVWDGVVDPNATSIAIGDGWTYERGALVSSSGSYKDYQIRRYRTQNDNIYTYGGGGGAGGNGGNGVGWGQARTDGAGGAGGGAPTGANSGWGGTGGAGGNGGDWGQYGGAGATGNTGGGGNLSGGTGGSAGGGGGGTHGIWGYNRCIYSGSGQVLGNRTSN